LDVFAKNLDDAKKKYFDSVGLKIVLSPFTSQGEYEYLFRHDSELDILKDRFIVFDLTEISKNKFLFPIVSLMVMDLVNQKIMLLPGIKKTLIIDEAWEIFKSSLRDFVEEMYRVVRKYDGRIFLATQNVLDIEASGIGDAITINSSISVILDHGGYENMKAPLMRILSLTNSEIDMIFSIRNDHEAGRDFFIKQGTKASVYRLNVSKVCAIAYDSRGITKKQIREELDSGKSINLALLAVSEKN
jgi:type IV secretory pathway VirB4 component